MAGSMHLDLLARRSQKTANVSKQFLCCLTGILSGKVFV